MLRFCGKSLMEQSGALRIEIAKEHLILDKNIWRAARDHFRYYEYYGTAIIHFVPVDDVHGNLVCYGWQDHEADRELRMLKELGREKNALQFADIFPDVAGIIVSGCNELAYQFVTYLKELHIPVSVKGKYWDYFGYENSGGMDDADDDGDQFVIRTEQLLKNPWDLFQKVARSASADFEYIDKIYEANLVLERIKDRKGEGAAWLPEKIKRKPVVILGAGDEALDVYDWLYGYGIDIKYFAADEGYEDQSGCLLGKKVVNVSGTFHEEADTVFIDAYGKNSAWGNRHTELFDYYGYERNENFFMFRDYTDITCSNLIHVLKGKRVFLTGDERLCGILSEYLERVEQGDIKLYGAEALRKETLTDEDLVFTVYLWYGLDADSKKLQASGRELDGIPHTDYFSDMRTFVEIDRYNRGAFGRYQTEQLIPKGILLNITYNYSGNIFFKGILDGHPDILLLQYDAFSNNLFVYCIRLASEQPENILSTLYRMLKTELGEEEFKVTFPYWSVFEKSMKRWLTLQEKFTSQELFVIFHIAYMEMMGSKKITDASQKVIYFDPHWIPPERRHFLVEWLESEKINGQAITVLRDSTKRITSICAKSLENNGEIRSAYGTVNWMVHDLTEHLGLGKKVSQYYQRFEVRFEDLKLHPEEELMKVCERMDIPWADSMLHTTEFGKTSSMGTVRDFDLKPVFNRYEKDWSEFDRFRLYFITSPYQKKCGYPYEDGGAFSRIELQEMFLKEFQFQRRVQFESAEDQAAYFLWAYEQMRWKLWDNRRQMLMDDTGPLFAPVEIGKSETELKLEEQKLIRENRKHWIGFIGKQEKIVLYGLGKDGVALIDCLDESKWPRLVLCDKKAQGKAYDFRGKRVISPQELCGKYRDYEILITSSRFYGPIRAELDDLGICADRIHCNTVQIWDKDESANKS